MRWLLLVAAVAIASGGKAHGQAPGPNRADRLKAVYLYNFGNYNEWPEGAFPNVPPAEQKFVIGVLGKTNPVQTVLKAIGAKKQVAKRTLESQMIPNVNAKWSCHILYIPATCPEPVVKAALARVKGKPVLIVGETKDFATPETGGHIQFFVQGAAIKFLIRPKAIAADKMKASAKILQIGEVLKN